MFSVADGHPHRAHLRFAGSAPEQGLQRGPSVAASLVGWIDRITDLDHPRRIGRPVIASSADGHLVPFIQMTPVTHAALAGSSSTCVLRLRHTALHSGPAKYAGRRTGLTAFAAARSPLAKARNTGAAKCTMRTSCGERLSNGSACSPGSTGQACQAHSPEAIQCPIVVAEASD